MRIIIIKLGALGDVVRTTPIAVALKKEHPDSHITWVTKKESLPLLEGHQYIEQVATLPYQPKETFDMAYNFDIEKDATDLMKSIKATHKFGFSEEGGYPLALNPGAEYYLNTVFDDDLKKSNTKTYQEMMFEAANLKFNNEPCVISLNKKDKLYAETFAQNNKIPTERLIGIHMGASKRWPSKSWDQSCIIEFIQLAKKRGFEVILFWGPLEKEKTEEIVEELAQKKIRVFMQEEGTNTKQFAALVSVCRYVVSADSFALHIALALKKRTAGLFFVTSPTEVEGYGLLKKLISPRLHEFFPQKSDQYDRALTKSIHPEDVLDALEH